MLCTRLAPVRSLIQASVRGYSTQSTPDPLRILFCGSDHFSIASLRALVKAKTDAPTLIQSIHVLHRPAKPTGRGLKIWKQVPIKQVAEELHLTTHAVDTFTGWELPPVDLNLVVAVSFGLLVPPRILNGIKYGGLNVHPSLLPDLRGPAPIEHALLKNREHTGVSIQTLHPEHFDQGAILAQTPAPGVRLSDNFDYAALQEHLATLGAEMLVDVLKARTFMPPLKDQGWYAKSGKPIDHAPKITKQHRHFDFATHSVADIRRLQRALGDPWCCLPNGDRLIVHEVGDEYPDSEHRKPGIWVDKGSSEVQFRAACANRATIWRSTYSGHRIGHGNSKLVHMFRPKS